MADDHNGPEETFRDTERWLRDRIAALEAKIARKNEALHPFAKCCEFIADDEDDEEWAKFRLLIGDYRRALAALAEK